MKIYHQNVFDRWPFDDNSIQAIITSPPYYSLRKYDIPDVIIGGDSECEHEFIDYKFNQDSGRHLEINSKDAMLSHHSNIPDMKLKAGFCTHCSAWRGQYGLEPTFQLYIEHTLLWCLEAKRVLRDDGVFFLNLGDSYNGSGGDHKAHHQNNSGFQGKYGDKHGSPGNRNNSLPSKCLLDIPSRVSIALVDNQGWIKRNNIIWYSPNKMPESVTDRFSKKHEMIFMMVKNPKYYFDLDGIRERWDEASIARLYRGNSGEGKYAGEIYSGMQPTATMSQKRPNRTTEYKACKNEGTGYGTDGKGIRQHSGNSLNHPLGKNPGDIFIFNTQPSSEKHYAMWPEELVKRMILCSTKPGDIVCDPFCGSATTLKVADKLNREAVGMDLGYKDIQDRRLSNIQKELI